MIISDTHRTAFIHIPKCGGTSVRRQLAAIDSTGGAFYDVTDHPALGRINTSHVPLGVLAEHFPQAFAKVCEYRTFALVREPFSRFASATFQRFEEFAGLNRVEVTLDLALAEARRAAEWLSKRPSFCDASHIHFARQSDYVDLGGRRIVSDVFRLDDLDAMSPVLERCCGVRLDSERRENTNFASANPLLAIVHKTKPIYSRLTTWEFRKRMVVTMQRLKLHGTGALYSRFCADPEIARFVSDYYADDLALYASLGAPAVSAPARPLASIRETRQ